MDKKQNNNSMEKSDSQTRQRNAELQNEINSFKVDIDKSVFVKTYEEKENLKIMKRNLVK